MRARRFALKAQTIDGIGCGALTVSADRETADHRNFTKGNIETCSFLVKFC